MQSTLETSIVISAMQEVPGEFIKHHNRPNSASACGGLPMRKSCCKEQRHDRRMKNVRVVGAEALSDAVDHHSVELTNVELLLLAGVAHAVADATAIFVRAHKFEHVNET